MTAQESNHVRAGQIAILSRVNPPDVLALQVRRGTRGRHISGGRVKDFHPLFTRTNDVLAKGGEAACSVALWLV
jgi:hypothetical protein